MGLLFFPRGGSAHVARNLASALPAAGWDADDPVGLAALAGPAGRRARVLPGLDVRPVDMTARARARRTRMLADPPMHPVLRGPPGRAGPRLRARSTTTRSSIRSRRGRARCRRPAPRTPTSCTCITSRRSTRRPQRVAPGVPVVGHLHGTELLMLEAIEADPCRWPHGLALGGAACATGRRAASA